MTPLLTWFSGASAESLCWALFHSLWQGLIWCLLLSISLSTLPRTKPQLRYLASLCCLIGLALGVLVTWSILKLPPGLMTSLTSLAPLQSAHENTAHATFPATVLAVTAAESSQESPSRDSRRRSRSDTPLRAAQGWLNDLIDRTCPQMLWAWMLGVAFNFFQCVRHRAAAAQWKRGEPIRDPAVLELFELLKRRLQIRRPVRLIASLRAYGPCVVGTFAPVILIPISLASGMTPDQWKAVLTHELAHLRRWDDLVNFGQQVLESLLFFNPAVWWISRQIRAEREACCDVWGVRITANSLNYAQVLLEIAEKLTMPQGATALAFADERAGSLMDRVRRLVAGNPSSRDRLTWPVSLFLILIAIAVIAILQRGSDLAIFSAARMLTDPERVTELAKVAEEVNPPLASATERLIVSGSVSTEDGGPLPKSIWIHSQTQNGNSGTGITQGEIKGAETDKFRVDVPPGITWLQFVGDGYATTVVGPYVSGRTAEVQDVQVVLKTGSPVTLEIADESGQPITGADVAASVWEGRNGFGLPKSQETDSAGQTVIKNIDSERSYSFTVTAPGFQRLNVAAARLLHDRPVRLQMTRAQIASGKVLGPDGTPLVGATLRKLRTRKFQHVDMSGAGLPDLAKTTDQGDFILDQLLDGYVYDLLVQHKDYASGILRNIQPGSRDRVIQLQDGVTVAGVIRGTPQQLQDLHKTYCSYRVLLSNVDPYERDELSFQSRLTLTQSDGEARFQLDHLPVGKLVITLGNERIEQTVSGPVSDLVIELKRNSMPPQREVELVFRKGGEVVAPQGQLQLSISHAFSGGQKQYDFTQAILSEGRATAQLAVPCEFRIQTNQLIGFTLAVDDFVAQVPTGEGKFVVDIPVQAAGGVSGVVLDVDGTVARNISVVLETVISRKTLLNTSEKRNLMNVQTNDSGEFFFTPVPFGAQCELRASREKFYLLGPQFTMSERLPLPEFKLQFNSPVSAGVRVLDPQGNPLPGIPVIIRCEHPRLNTSWGPGETTDKQGEVVVPRINPEMVSSYLAIVAPTKTYRNSVVHLQANQTVEVRLQPGLFLTGTLVHKDGHPLSGRRLTASAGRYYGMDQNQYAAESMTDDQGKFRFSNLPAEEIRIQLEYGQYVGDQKYIPTAENQIKPIIIQSGY